MSCLGTPSLLRSRLLFAILLLGVCSISAHAGSPDWLRAAAQVQTPVQPDDVNGIVLFEEEVTTVKENGEVKTNYRRATRILRTAGRNLGHATVYFDSETKLTYFKAWSIPAQGNEYEVKERDAIEATPFSGELYADTRLKIIEIPAPDPGSVIGYEYEQKRRPNVMQDVWTIQDSLPVVRSRYILNLPPGWEVDTVWLNYAKAEPTVNGTTYTWELTNIPAVKHERGRPAFRAVAGRMGMKFIPPGSAHDRAHTEWKDVGAFAYGLISPRLQSSPAIQDRARTLTAGKTTRMDKVRALAAFAQRDVRYVAIEIGIGGYQPHFATDIFSNRYGDCKDKVTLLATMLKEAGIDSFPVLAQTERGVVADRFPSMYSFNHAIIAIPWPASEPDKGIFSLVQHPRLGRLLIFDPTSEMTPVGYLPSSEQGNQALVVTPEGGELIDLPLQPPSANELVRTADLQLSGTGILSGQVREVRTGASAVEYREELLALQAPQRVKKMENFLADFLNNFVLMDYQVENLEDFDKELVVKYSFQAENYAKTVGGMILVRPRVFGSKSGGMLDLKDRKYPYELESPTLQTDEFRIKLPFGYTVDELPPPTAVQNPAATYSSEARLEGDVLTYKREFKAEQVMVPTEKLGELNAAYKKIQADERNAAVLKRKEPN